MGLYSGNDKLEELIAAGYRLPASKVAEYRETYADNKKVLELIIKAAPPAQ